MAPSALIGLVVFGTLLVLFVLYAGSHRASREPKRPSSRQDSRNESD